MTWRGERHHRCQYVGLRHWFEFDLLLYVTPNFMKDIVSVEVEVESRKYRFFRSVKIPHECRGKCLDIVSRSSIQVRVKSEDAGGIY